MISPRLLLCCATVPSVSCMPIIMAHTRYNRNLQSIPADVIFQSVKSTAKSASWTISSFLFAFGLLFSSVIFMRRSFRINSPFYTHGAVLIFFVETGPSKTLANS